MVDNLNIQTELADLVRRVRMLETASPLARTTITRGALTVVSAEGLIVEGSAKVTGTFELDGTMNADGTITLTGDLTVQGGGDITVAGSVPMVLGDVSGRAGISWGSAVLSSNGGGVAMEVGTGGVGARPDDVVMFRGTRAIILDDSGPQFMNLPTTTSAPNAYIDSNGRLYRSTGIGA